VTATQRMEFGLFIAPHHPVGENPTLTLERHLDLVETLEALGYDEVWFGEHHSAGWETIASPELMIAAAAERTKRIRLGTGVVSLPYHHPLMVVDRMIQLDHMTRGRAMLGVGPGALSSDAYMMGIDPMTQRPRMNEALDAIMALLNSDEPVNRETDWFTLRDARLQMRPYSSPHFPITVASTFSPSGMVAAGAHGLGVLSLGGSVGRIILNLNDQWRIGEQAAAQHGHTMDRSQWRVVLPFYLAEDRDEAINDVRQGFYDFQHNYVGSVLGRTPQDGEDDIGLLAERDQAMVGTPDDAIRILTNLQQQTGGFGSFTGLFHAWAPEHKLQRSYELFARYVMPHFQGQIKPLLDSERWAIDNRETLFGQIPAAIKQAFADAGETLPPQEDAAKSPTADND